MSLDRPRRPRHRTPRALADAVEAHELQEDTQGVVDLGLVKDLPVVQQLGDGVAHPQDAVREQQLQNGVQQPARCTP